MAHNRLRQHEWSAAWQRAWQLSEFTVRLAPQLAERLGDEVHRLIDSYRGLVLDDARDAAPVRVHFHAFPRSAD